MNHRVSIIVSSTSTTESGLGSPEVCSKASCLSKSVFSKECVHCTFLYIVEPCAEFTCYSPLVLCHSHFLSRVNAQQWSPRTPHTRTKHSTQSGVFVHFFLLFFFFPTCHSRPSATRLSVRRELQAADEKIWLPTSCVFAVVTANACLKNLNPRTESYTSGSRTPSVDLHFRSFSTSL